jgi:hypothetical protein
MTSQFKERTGAIFPLLLEQHIQNILGRYEWCRLCLLENKDGGGYKLYDNKTSTVAGVVKLDVLPPGGVGVVTLWRFTNPSLAARVLRCVTTVGNEMDLAMLLLQIEEGSFLDNEVVKNELQDLNWHSLESFYNDWLQCNTTLMVRRYETGEPVKLECEIDTSNHPIPLMKAGTPSEEEEEASDDPDDYDEAPEE